MGGNLPSNAARIPIFDEAGKGDNRPEITVRATRDSKAFSSQLAKDRRRP